MPHIKQIIFNYNLWSYGIITQLIIEAYLKLFQIDEEHILYNN